MTDLVLGGSAPRIVTKLRATGGLATTVNTALHINGVKNAGGAGSTITYNPATRACTPMCHGTETW